MFKQTVMSLVLGALALVTALHLAFGPARDSDASAKAILWDGNNAQPIPDTATVRDNTVHLQLPESGWASVALPAGQINTDAYAFLHIALVEPEDQPLAILTWNNNTSEQQVQTYILESKSRRSLWIATEELRNWDGGVNDVRLVFIGKAGDTIQVKNFSLLPASLARQLSALYSDWTGFVPWTRSAINSHTGVTNVSSFYPVPLTVALLCLSLLGYTILLILLRKRWRFSWPVVSLIFLTCWIALDLAWQTRLLQQLAETARTFSGKTTQQKLAVGPDAKLYNFVMQAKQQLPETSSRLFVSSSDEYNGLRSAYYLYPHNVFWSLRGPELPPLYHLRGGDHILLVRPTKLVFDHKKNRLWVTDKKIVRAELVYRDPRGLLVRVL